MNSAPSPDSCAARISSSALRIGARRSRPWRASPISRSACGPGREGRLRMVGVAPSGGGYWGARWGGGGRAPAPMARFRNFAKRLRLEQEAQFVDVVDVRVGERGDRETAPFGNHQPFARESRERLAHGGP